MIVKSKDLEVSARDRKAFPRAPFPQVAFMGASNVGKSSLLNRLLGARRLARTSKTPGRTRAIDFYMVNRRLYFVDLPGYGYARVPAAIRAAWKDLVESYLESKPGPDLGILLIDARRGPGAQDLLLLEWLRSRDLDFRVVLTKSDKLSRSRVAQIAQRMADDLGLPCDERLPAASAITGDGIPSIWNLIDRVCDRHRSHSLNLPAPGGGGIIAPGRAPASVRTRPSLNK